MISPMSLLAGAARRANLAHRHTGRPFDPRTSIAPPSRWHPWVHYGVMVPDLPAPHRTFGVMSIVGTPGVAVFANDYAITTTPRDTAYLVSATGAMTHGAFRTYSIAEDCTLAADGSLVRFGQDLTIAGTYPDFEVRRRHPEVDVDLRLRATDRVTHFADLPGRAYSHWSLLCEYEGTVGSTPAAGLCTFEYARGVGVRPPVPGVPHLPATFFTYHVINVDDRTQLLYAEARLAGGEPVLRAAYVRGLDDPGSQYDDARLVVTSHEPRPVPTPRGGTMLLPRGLTLGVPGRDGAEEIRLEGVANDDWSHGLGAGFVGSYDYEGVFRGRPCGGTAYVEYVDLDAGARTGTTPDPT